MLAIITLLAVMAGPIVTTSPIYTNVVSNVVSIISTKPVEGPCPECGQPNHHDRRIQLLNSYEQYLVYVSSPTHTNTVVVGTGPVKTWVSTNVILRQNPYAPQQQWPVPPLQGVLTPTNSK